MGPDGPAAATAGHDIAYIALAGALHAIGQRGGPPSIPLNLLGDYGGGSTFIVLGVLSALLQARRTGRGQVVDAAIVDGVSHLLSQAYGMLGSGRWVDDREQNLFDGGSPYYSVYETSDGRHMAVGALEPKFFALLLHMLDIDRSEIDPADQLDQASWPKMRSVIADRFGSRTQEEWTAVFSGSDACVAPVLALRDVAAHPHISARQSVVELNGVVQPGLAPRFSGSPDSPIGTPPLPGEHTIEVLAAAGLPARALVECGAAVQAGQPGNSPG